MAGNGILACIVNSLDADVFFNIQRTVFTTNFKLHAYILSSPTEITHYFWSMMIAILRSRNREFVIPPDPREFYETV